MTRSSFNEALDRLSIKCRHFESLNLSTTQKMLIITDVGDLLRLGTEFKQLTPEDNFSTAISMLTKYENKIDEVLLKLSQHQEQDKTSALLKSMEDIITMSKTSNYGKT